MNKKNNPFFKKDKKFKNVKIGQKFTYKKIVSSSMIQSYASLIGDKNPLHYKSKRKSNSKIYAHGMLIGSLVSTLLGSHFPIKNNLLLSINLNFKKPVLPNQKVKVVAAIAGKSDYKNIIMLKINIYQVKKLLIVGDAIIKVNSK